MKAVFICYILIGIVVLFRIVISSRVEPFPDGQLISFQTRIFTNPTVQGKTERVSVVAQGRKLSVTLPRFSGYGYGDAIQITGKVNTSVLDDKRVVSSMYFPKIQKVLNDTGFIFHTAAWVREKVSGVFEQGLPHDQASLLMGIVFGINAGFDKADQDAFQKTGVMHVIAASGMNVTLLVGFLMPLFAKIMPRQWALACTVLAIASYAVMAGLSASIVRAALMASIGYIGLMLGRQKTALIGIYLTGCIMIIITPTVVFDIGFQLSFAATLGILLIKPLFPSLKALKGFLFEDLTTTFSAQIATIPILLYYFHAIGVLSLLVNGLVLWVVAPVMIIGSIAALSGIIFPWIGSVLALLTMPLLSYFFFIVRFFGSFSPIFMIDELPISLVFAYYFLTAVCSMLIMKYRAMRKALLVESKKASS